jgi:hypothetical protein
MASIALVARNNSDALEYLVETSGRPLWASTPGTAARFATIRDATRAALRLPGSLRAFALPMEASSQA